MYINRINSQKGIAQLAVLAVMAFLVLGIPTATKLVQENQENRSKASESNIPTNGLCGTANGKTFSSLSLEKDDHTLFCQKSSGVTITNVSENDYSWKCIGVNDGATADCSATINPNTNTADAGISATKTDLYYRFRESNDTRVLGVGMTVLSTIRLNTYEKSISSAKIVYCHTDKLEPIRGSVSGDQLNTVVEHQKVGNNCAVLKVNFDINKKLTGNTAYEIKIATKIVKTGSGTLSFDVPNSSVLGLNGEIVKFTEFTYGADFKIESDEIISKLTPTPVPSSPYLFFNPQNQNHKVGDTFEVTAGVNSAANIIGGVDIVGTYDSSKLELISINKSPLMVFINKGDCTNPENTITGKFSLTCFITDSREAMMVKGDLVKLTFKAKSTGPAKIQFVCEKNNTHDSNIMRTDGPDDLIVCDKNINANIVIATESTTVNGICGPLKASQVTANIDKERPELLCKTGKVGNFTKTPDAYWWDCTGINGGSSTGCGFDNPGDNNVINGDCGTVKFSQLSKNSPKDKKITLCKSGKLGEFFTVYENPRSTDLTYVWDCLGSNGGSDIQCNVADPNMIIDGVCGKAKYNELTVNSDKNKPELLCQSGFVENFTRTIPKCVTGSNCPPPFYSWICTNVRNGGNGVKCSVKQASFQTQVIDGRCGTVKYSQLTENSDKDKPEILCKSGKVTEFSKMTPNCITASNCPPSFYSWRCLGSNGAKTVKCTVKSNITGSIPATGIKTSPLGLTLKAGQNKNLTLILTPGNSTDIVKWTTTGDGLVKIISIPKAPKCPPPGSNTKCIEDVPSTNRLQITGLKPGTTKIKLTTSSGKTTTATVVIKK